MISSLMAVSIGPVQDFILAARRTRDLWFGSLILSEISKSVARMLSEHAELIFPSTLDPQRDLSPGSGFNVANVILCIASLYDEPRELALMAEKTAKACWENAAREAWDRAAKVIPRNLNENRWCGQVSDVIEVYSAWVPFDPVIHSYHDQRARVMRLLSGRKACREFLPSQESGMRIPKSSLDGRRETVFEGKIDLENIPVELRGQLGLSVGEELDAVGLTKRLGGDRHACPSVSTIAASSWVRGAAIKCQRELSLLSGLCKGLVESGLTPANWEQFASFPFEGAVIFPGRLKSMIDEHEIVVQTKDEAANIELFALFAKDINSIIKDPSPYYVIIAADGDRVGAAISSLRTPEEHKRFSQALSSFAASARKEIERCFGWPVYLGGDDILAFLPLDTALNCASVLNQGFHRTIRSSGLDFAAQVPTLSVGMVIVHNREPLGESLRHARDAEKTAKGADRNGLAITYHPRSGASVSARGRWDEGFFNQVESLTQLHQTEQISDTAAFDLREMSQHYKGWARNKGTAETLGEDFKRYMRRKKGQRVLQEDVALAAHLENLKSSEDILDLANQMILSRLFAQSRMLSGWIPAARTEGGAT